MAQMKPVWWMAGLCSGSAAIASRLIGGSEIWLGMLAPLAVVSVSWLFMVRTYTKHPEQLTPVMIAAFGGKLVLFGAYVGLAIGVLHVRAVPFAASFAAYFITLHMAEAVCLQRLFAEGMRAA
jgi:hypothetical protein